MLLNPCYFHYLHPLFPPSSRILIYSILQTSHLPLMQTSRFPGKQGVPSCTWSANFLEKYKPNNPLGVQCNSHGETKEENDNVSNHLVPPSKMVIFHPEIAALCMLCGPRYGRFRISWIKAFATSFPGFSVWNWEGPREKPLERGWGVRGYAHGSWFTSRMLNANTLMQPSV